MDLSKHSSVREMAEALRIVVRKAIAGKHHCLPAKLNQLNKELLVRLQETGIAVISSTIISNKFALRVAITNHRSHLQDFDLLINTVLNIGLILEAELT